ncbi:RluA family pseudouridine synthase [Prescottella sp. R16]|uniref:RluA family pseudouridine synthase n=1 Tax=Prescottella sp. R16 TaxID=3064529 RepID=UPI00272E3DD7|nr:RluA family pseudouridine synthase [Prescottella sp. R16]
MPTAPLPVRDGLNPTRLRLPRAGMWPTALAYLLDRFPTDTVRLREKVESGEVVDEHGTPIDATSPFRPHGFLYLYRDPPVEKRVPFEIDVLYRDENLLVVDKPHFLATTPRGAYVAESALVRLRRDLDLPELVPAHRLDRVTAGVLIFTVRPPVRRAYQSLFDARLVTKVYEALAPHDPTLSLPRTVRSRIVKERGVLQAREVSGEPNAESRIELLETIDGTIGRYRLSPRTGKTHQLRLHMSSLGVPILGDNFYPVVRDVAPDDYRAPLQLLARSIAFDDPFTGEHRRFESRRRLTPPPAG